MTDWTAFSGLLGVVLVLLLSLARLSQDTVSEGVDASETTHTQPSRTTTSTTTVSTTDPSPSSDHHGNEALTTHATNGRRERDGERAINNEIPRVTSGGAAADAPLQQPQLSTGLLLVNVALSQGLFALVLVAGALYTSIPPTALGIGQDSVGLLALGVGGVTGLALYAANAVGAAGASALGYEYEEQLRDLLTPETRVGWLLLLCGVLPIIAGFEELLFRGALIGVLSSGFDISPWFLAGGSSAVFAFGHGAQGRLGILVTGVLGFVLAAVFIYTNSLLTVIVAHYLVNALEFLIGGAMGIEWSEQLQ